MKISKIVFGLPRLSDANLEKEALAIIAAMTGNKNFPTPIPKLKDVSTAIADFSNFLSMSQTGDKVQIAIKNSKKDALLTMLRSLGAYVNFIADGDKGVIMSAGFETAKDNPSALPITQPKNFKVTNGMNAGQATTSVSGVKRVKTYLHQYTPDPLTDASVWQSEYVSTRSYTFSGLESGRKFWFRVAAIGTGKQIAYTDPLSMIIQ